ncbi:MAG: phage portal protein [Epsilonproteobacteria bacterium]|nr:MAG: phage portal protein [Campylobacterota bacterium]
MFNLFGKKSTEKRLLSVDNTPQSLIFGGTTQNALDIPAVYSCVNLISNAVASLPVDIFVNGIETPGHKALDFITDPLGGMTKFMFLSAIVRNMLLDGNAFVEIENDGLLLHDTKDVQIYLDDRKYILYYIVKSEKTGNNKKVLPGQMLHFKRLTNDGRGQIGVSVIHSFNKLFEEVTATTNHIRDYLDNGLNAALWLEIPGRHKPESLETMRTKIADLYQGLSGRNKIPTLTDGIQLRELNNNSLVDASVQSLKEAQLKDISMIFNIPLTLLDASSGTYGNTVEANLMFLKTCISPLLRNIEDEFNSKINYSGDVGYKFDVSAFITGTFETQIQTLNTAVSGGIMTQNEARKRLGLKELADGNKLFAPAGTPTSKENG